MAPHERDPHEYELSPLERDRVFDTVIFQLELQDLREAQHPTLRYIGGQPGAGKSALQQRILSRLDEAEGFDTSVEINNDKYRVHHPRYQELRERDDQTASFYTNQDCNYWIERALQVAFERRPHVLLESSLRRGDEVTATTTRARNHGFATVLNVVVAHEYDSRLGIAGRYLGDLASGSPHARYVISEVHDESYRQLPDALAQFGTPAAAFDAVTLNDRSGRLLYRHAPAADDPAALRDAYLYLRDMARPDPAGAIERCDIYIDQARRFERLECLRDLLALREEIERQ